MKNKNKFKTIILILGISLAITGIYISSNVSFINSSESIDVKSPKSSDFWTLNYIYVDNNWSTTASTYAWCSGDGSWNNPYLIENVTIDASGSPTGSGIFIHNSTNDYFVIKNCTVFNAGLPDAGIRLENTNNGFLIDNNCSYNYLGILLEPYCYNNTISGNTLNNNQWQGLFLRDSCSDNIILGNTANDNGESGIRIALDCNNNDILGNTVNSNNHQGIMIWINSDDNIISGNTIEGNNHGISLQNQIDNNIISNNILSGNNIGIRLMDQCDNNTISGNIATNNGEDGIHVENNCNYNTISGNTVNGNSLNGIWLRDHCDNNTLSGNTANNNDERGITISWYCGNNTLSGNTADNNNYYGILLSNYCEDNIVSNNNANENDPGGIHLWNFCHSNIVLDNIITDNSDYGIHLFNSDDNNFTGNIIYYTNLYGVFLDAGCDDNLFYLNDFIGNDCHARDEGNNKWDDGQYGNYWDNYSGYDILPMDGIGDIPHPLPIDKYDTKPIMALGRDIDGDTFSDSEEASYGTNALDASWYPMPNLEALHLSSITVYNKTSFDIAFSITNNGIWKAEGVVIVLECVELALTFYDNSLSPLVLDVDETMYLTINCGPIAQEGEYTLSLTVDPSNTVLETYSSKDGSLRGDAETDNSQTATLTILSEDPPEIYTSPPTDMTPIVISSIAGVIGLIAVVLVFMRTKSRTG